MDLSNRDVWRPIADYEDRYFVSFCGEVYSVKARRLKAIRESSDGYLITDLIAKGIRKSRSVHDLVIRAFVGLPAETSLTVDHIDNNKQNNHFANLRWATRSTQIRKSWEAGERTGRVLSNEDVRQIRILLDRLSQKEIGKRFGVSRCTISGIANGKKHGSKDPPPEDGGSCHDSPTCQSGQA